MTSDPVLAPAVPEAGDESAPRASPAHASILVADDESGLLHAVERALTRSGYHVRSATDGGEAMGLLAGGGFDVVLSDIRMPGMNGIALLRAIRERDLEIPVLLMTGSPDIDTAADAVRYGASEYIVKPFTLDRLEQSVRKAVAMGALARAKRASLRLLDSGRPEAGDLAGLEVTLARALQSMWMAFQPIVNVKTRSVFAHEGLLRSDELALPHPGAVIDAAERLGRLWDVGRAVRRNVADAVRQAPIETLTFVNLHASDLTDDELFSASSPLTGIASRVVLEVTERASLDGVQDLRDRVARLRGLGFRIAIDDLGAGYAGLNSFAQLEPEFVKLDMSLVRDIDRNAIKRKLVGSMTKLCGEMGISVVAEGIETAEERDTLIAMGCDLLQGYLFARPGRPFPKVAW